METSYKLTVASEAEASRIMLLKDRHISPTKSEMKPHTKATKLANARTRRIGAYSISQRIQNIGYRTEVAAVALNNKNEHN